MDKIRKKIFILLFSTALVFSFSTMFGTTYAAASDNCDTGLLKFLCDNSQNDPPDKGEFAQLITAARTFIVRIGGFISVLMIVIGGVMYITSAGNKNQVDKAKKIFTGAIVGLIMIISARAILGIFITMLGGKYK